MQLDIRVTTATALSLVWCVFYADVARSQSEITVHSIELPGREFRRIVTSGFAPNGQTIAVVTEEDARTESQQFRFDQTIWLIDWNEKKVIRKLHTFSDVLHTGTQVLSVDVSDSRSLLAMLDNRRAWQGRWPELKTQPSSFSQIVGLRPEDRFRLLAISPDGNSCYSIIEASEFPNAAKRLERRSLRNVNVIEAMDGRSLRGILPDRRGQILTGGTRDGIEVRNSVSLKTVKRFSLGPNLECDVLCLDAEASNAMVCLWNLDRRVLVLNLMTGHTQALSFPDGMDCNTASLHPAGSHALACLTRRTADGIEHRLCVAQPGKHTILPWNQPDEELFYCALDPFRWRGVAASKAGDRTSLSVFEVASSHPALGRTHKRTKDSSPYRDR